MAITEKSPQMYIMSVDGNGNRAGSSSAPLFVSVGTTLGNEVSIDSIAGGVVLGTVTTVDTVSSVTTVDTVTDVTTVATVTDVTTVADVTTVGTITNTVPTDEAAATWVVAAADAQIKASAGTVYGVVVSFDGVTAGDKIEIKNSTDNSGTSLCTIVAQAADAVYAFNPAKGGAYSTGIYYDVTLTGGAATATIAFS